MSNLLILGAGGHGKVVAETAIATGKWNTISFLDNNSDLSEVLDLPVLGGFDSYQDHLGIYKSAFVAIGNNKNRLLWLEKLEKAGYQIPSIIHPFSVVSNYSEIGLGSIIMPGVVVNANSIISEGCILNTSSTVDHDCMLENGVHVSPGVNVSGTVHIKKCTWLGVGSKVSNNISIGSNVIVAAGSTVIHDIPDNVMVAGVPAKIKKHFGDEE